MGSEKRSRRAVLLAVLAYAVLTLVFTYPLPLQLGTAVVGREVDAEQHLWSFWWMHKALLEDGTNPFWTHALYYPDGVSLLFFAFNLPHALLSMPLQEVIGLLAAFNLLALLTFVAVAGATHWLAYDVTGHHGAAFVAGMIFAFAPLQMFHFNVGQTNLFAVEFLPLYILCVRRWLNGGSRRWLIGSVLALVGSSFCDWQFAVYMQLFTAVMLVVAALEGRREWRSTIRRLGWRFVALEALYLLMVAPIVVPMLRELTSPVDYMVRPRRDTIAHSADLLASLIPNPLHPLWGDWAQDQIARLQSPGILMVPTSISYVALVLAIVGALQSWQRAQLWVLCGLTFWVLSLGPQLRLLGTVTNLHLPYDLLFRIKVVQVSRAPARYMIPALLCLAILAAIGVQAWLQRRAQAGRRERPTWARRVVFGIAAVALAFELLPAPSAAAPPAPAPEFFTDGTLRDAGALLEVPNPSNLGMYYLTLHGRPVLYGELSRDNPVSPQLEYLRRGLWRDDVFEQGVLNWLCTADFFDVTHLVVYQTLPGAEEFAPMITERFGPEALLRSTPAAALYSLPRSPTDPQQTCALLGPGWGTTRPFGNDQPVYRWMAEQASLELLGREPSRVRLHFTVHSFAQTRHLQVRQGDRVLSEFEVGVAPQPVSLDVDLPAGRTQLHLQSREPAQSPAEFGYPETDPVALGISAIWVERQ